jgi:putative ABC transport system substrate-binding protein
VNNRRKLVIALGAGALAAPFKLLAQPATKVWRVGYLVPRSRPVSLESDFLGAFPRGMRELGYLEGKNLAIEWRFADGRYERLSGLAAELVQLKVDVIVANATEAVSAAQKATSTIPIVMGNANEPVVNGFVASLARPGGNITGLSSIAADLSPKYLEMLLSIVPRLSRVAVLINPANTANVTILRNIQAVAPKAGVTILVAEARSSQEIEGAFITMAKAKAQALVFASNALFMQQRRQIAELAMTNRLPCVSAYREYVDVGALMSYGPNIADMYLRAATFVDKIFRGAKPADLPVEQPTKFELFINGKTAKTLGLKIPQSLLIMADKVIE